MRKIAITLTITLSNAGCAWLFQQKPEDTYSKGTQPQCSDSTGWAVVDGVFAILGAATMIVVATAPEGEYPDPGPLFIGGAFDVLIHGASAATGVGWAKKCRDAKARYASQPDEPEIEERSPAPTMAPPPIVVRSPVVVPRGFYCSASPGNATVGFCVRDKADCQRTRDVSLAALPELTECVLTERAFCFGDRCAPNVEACDAARLRALGPDGQGHVCAETE